MNITRGISLSLLTGLIAFALGCDSGENDGTDAVKKRQDRKGKSTTKKDRGQGSMTIGDDEWTAESARVRVNDHRVNLSMSRTDIVDNTVSRQSLTLSITGFKGPGEYETGGMSGSMFVSVSMDASGAKNAGTDKEAGKLITSSLSKARTVQLRGAKVVIVAASETEVSGTFSWSPPAGSKDPEVSNGKFRALIRAKK
jgi:hypothetical protein